MARQDTPCGRMPIWKWTLLFIAGLFIFFVAYGLSNGVNAIHSIHPLLKDLCILGAGCVILMTYWGWITITEKRPTYEISYKSFLPETGKGLAIGFLYFCAITLILTLAGMYKLDHVSDDYMGVLMAFCNFFIVAVGEEVLFRGILFRMIDERFNTWVALLVSALVFGFVHIMNPNAGVWSSVAIAIEAGLMLGLAYKYSGTLWLPIGIHWAWNFTQGNVFGFGVSGTDAGAALLVPTISGPDFLTGGSFGPEASITAAAIGLLISLAFYRAYRKK